MMERALGPWVCLQSLSFNQILCLLNFCVPLCLSATRSSHWAVQLGRHLPSTVFHTFLPILAHGLRRLVSQQDCDETLSAD